MLQQLSFPLHQQQFDTQSRHLDDPQSIHQQEQLQQQQQSGSGSGTAQGYIDESGKLCILQFGPETINDEVDENNIIVQATGATTKQFNRHGTREKTRSSQKRRKKKKARQQTKKEFCKNLLYYTF